jgi:hypothetical protein
MQGAESETLLRVTIVPLRYAQHRCATVRRATIPSAPRAAALCLFTVLRVRVTHSRGTYWTKRREGIMRFAGVSLLLGSLVSALAMPGLSAAQDVHSQRIKTEAYPPKNPEHQQVYDLLKQRQWLEKAREFFGIFKLPQDITIFTRSCGMSNAWYVQGTVTVCYEYLDDILKSMPEETTPEGITQADAIIGQFAYTVAHEMGHALFDILDIPLLGQPEDAADEFAAYMMLELGKEQARRFILGAAYSYANYLKNPKVTVNRIAFADAHSAPLQRYYSWRADLARGRFSSTIDISSVPYVAS